MATYTATQLAQFALNVAVATQNQCLEGQIEPGSKGGLTILTGCIVMLAEALLAINSSNTGGPASVPGSLTVGKYSVNQPSTSPIQV